MIDVSPELLAFLKEEYDRCEDQTLEDERITAIERYNGEPYGDEQDGRSQVVARDTAETTDYMVISILRTIVSGERVVEFVHRNTEAADQATETIMHLLMDEQDGYSILHDWLKAGLLEKNAVAMTYGEPRPPKRHKQEGVSALALMAAEQQGLKVVEAEETGEESEEGPLFNVTILEERGPKFCDAAVPNEEFYCSPDARSLTEAPLKGRKRLRPVHELIAEGFDAEELRSVGDTDDNLLSNARDEDRHVHGARRGAARQVWWHEDYVTFDANGDGVAELLYIRRTGDFKIFSIEEMEDADDHPFEDWCPFPMQHRRIGQSLADKVMDLERINTVLLRQSLDGIYISNKPTTYVHEDSIGETTLEDLLTVSAVGPVVRWKGNVQPVERKGAFDAAVGFNALEYVERKRESRTGITRLNMGLDDETLNDTARGQSQLIQKGEQMEEYVARNFANGLAKLITKKAKLLRRYGQPITVPIDGQYVEVDPKTWPEDMIARVKVGLGSSRKETRLAYRREILEYQMAALEAGLPIVGPEHLFASAKGFIKEAQLGEATEFFADPAQMGPQQQKPDPEMAKVQAEMQAKQAELQMEHQASQGQLQLKLMEIQGKLQMAREDMQQRAVLEQQKAFIETQLAQQQAAMEANLERMKLHLAAQSSARDADRRDRETDGKINNLRKGGKLNK